ncbi:hypothetical protein IU487_33740 [Nocardia puris]|uniref:hypothetical protein n=1 Tax=Nocardia puris TaxID=208602 RepID=UPI0018958741|nr:hypothetical protein [Nocardia puris]MBF6215964.1 hypothetical protein [Nocardia puris]
MIALTSAGSRSVFVHIGGDEIRVIVAATKTSDAKSEAVREAGFELVERWLSTGRS